MKRMVAANTYTVRLQPYIHTQDAAVSGALASKPAKPSDLQHHTSNTNLERSPHIRLAYTMNKSPPPKAPNGEIAVIVLGGDTLEKRHLTMYRSGAACYPCCRKREKHVCETPRMPRYLAARRGKNNSPIRPGCHALACS
jgi:hypothetical protein